MQKYSGFILLLSVVLATSLLFLLFYKQYFAPTTPVGELGEVQPNTIEGAVPANGIERVRADVDAAEKTRQLLNSKNAELNRELGQ